MREPLDNPDCIARRYDEGDDVIKPGRILACVRYDGVRDDTIDGNPTFDLVTYVKPHSSTTSIVGLLTLEGRRQMRTVSDESLYLDLEAGLKRFIQFKDRYYRDLAIVMGKRVDLAEKATLAESRRVQDLRSLQSKYTAEHVAFLEANELTNKTQVV